jgi:hypothetical protein
MLTTLLAGSHAQLTPSATPPIESLREISNEHVSWVLEFTGTRPIAHEGSVTDDWLTFLISLKLSPDGQSLSAKVRRELARELMLAFRDEKRWVAAHVLSVFLVGGEYNTGVNSWAELPLRRGKDGTVVIEPSQRIRIADFWKERLDRLSQP